MRPFLLISIFFLSIAGCQEAKTNAPETLLNDKAPSFAEGFRFVQIEGQSCVELLNLEADSTQVLCAICRGLENAPSSNIISLGEDASFATLSTTHLAYFWKMQALDQVSGTAFASYVRNSEVRTRLEDGRIADISGDKEVDTEGLISIQPNALITYPYGDANYDRIKALGIHIIPFSEYLETHPLGRAEWIKVVGFLTNREEQANAAFESIRVAYEAARDSIQHVSSEDRPIVFTGSHSNGMWYAPPGNSYISQFIQDAGGTYLFQDRLQKGNLSMQFESLFHEAMTADYWGKVIFDEGELTLDDLRADDERYSELPAFKEGKVFYCNAAETDYFGDAIVEPEEILRDLISIFYPDSMQRDYVYFRPISSSDQP